MPFLLTSFQCSSFPSLYTRLNVCWDDKLLWCVNTYSYCCPGCPPTDICSEFGYSVLQILINYGT